jgi:surfactin synthase thioesterase subunit
VLEPAAGDGPDAVQAEIAAVWARVLDLPVAGIGADDSFFEVGGNSLSALRVVLELEGQVTLTDLIRHPRLGQLARLVANRSDEDGHQLVHLLSSSAAGTRCALVCVPYPGGHPINFQPLAGALEEITSDIAVYAVEQPGHSPDRPGEFVDIAETARRIAAELAEVAEVADTPVLIWGHCGGASVAVELAHQLEASGVELRGLMIGSKLLPTCSDMQESIDMITGWSDTDILRYMVDETGYTDLEGLDAARTAHNGQVFRHDVLGGYRYFMSLSETRPWTIKAPFWFVVAGDDPGLTHYPAEYGRWSLLAEEVRLQVLDKGGHYFVRANPVGTAELVDRVWTGTLEEV